MLYILLTHHLMPRRCLWSYFDTPHTYKYFVPQNYTYAL